MSTQRLTGDEAVEFLASKAVRLSNALDEVIARSGDPPAVIVAACRLQLLMFEGIISRTGDTAQLTALDMVWKRIKPDAEVALASSLPTEGNAEA